MKILKNICYANLKVYSRIDFDDFVFDPIKEYAKSASSHYVLRLKPKSCRRKTGTVNRFNFEFGGL